MIILIISIIIRGFLVWQTRNNSLYFPDEKEYVKLAENIKNGLGFSYHGKLTSFRPPLYPLFLAIFNYLDSENTIILVRVTQCLLNLFTGIFVFLITIRFAQYRIALLSMMFFFFNGELLGMCLIIFGETLFIFLFILGFYFLTVFLDSDRKLFLILSGISFTLSALVRDISFYFLIPLAAYLIYRAPKVLSLKQRFFRGGMLILTMLIVILPWVIRNYKVHKEVMFTSTVGALNIYYSHNDNTPLMRAEEMWQHLSINDSTYYYDAVFKELPINTEMEKKREAMRLGLEYIIQNPMMTLKRAFFRILDFLSVDRIVTNQLINGWFGTENRNILLFSVFYIFLSYTTVVIGSVYGYLFYTIHPYKLIIFGWICINILLHSIVASHPRYHLPLMPFLSISCAYAIVNIKYIWNLKRSRRFIIGLVVSLVLISIWSFELLYFDIDKIKWFFNKL